MNQLAGIPRNRDISVPLCPCVAISICICVVAFSLRSAPIPGICGTLRTRRLPLAIHAARQSDGRDWGDWGIGKVVEISNLTFKNVHSHTEDPVLYYVKERKTPGRLALEF